ncbi:hypothetical protein EV181_004179, partial [Coemansia sp. RSA 532]
MGSLLSLLRGGSGGHSGGLSRSSRETQASARFAKQFNEFIFNLGDVRNAQYVEENFPEGNRILRVGLELLERVSAYNDGSNEVRMAISQPTQENEEAAWRKVGPSVALLRECFEFAQSVEKVIPDVLEELSSHADDADPQRADRNRGLARLLADLMQNAFAFDALKADIARYIIPHDVSNQMSLFYAYHNPMVRTVIDSATKFAQESGNQQIVLDCLSALAAGSASTVKHARADSAKSERMCMLVLVTCCILYDWISPKGVSDAQSGIDAKAALDLVSERTLVDSTPADKVARVLAKRGAAAGTYSQHAVNFGHVQQSVSNRRQIEHRLVLRQEPNRSRMCGIGEKDTTPPPATIPTLAVGPVLAPDRRPVDPPPIIQLHVSDPTTSNNRVYLHNPYYFMYATLMDERGERELNTLSDKKARTMTGSVVASLAHLKDIDGNDGAFFVFPDLSVRCEGVYRLKFSLFEIVGNQVFFCKSITSTMFTVYSAKKFPGMEESTRLTKLFAEQGLKIRVRKEQKTGRPKGARSRPIATALHSESGPPAPLSHISTWGDPRPHSSGSMTYPGMAGHPDHPQQQQQQPPPPAPYSAAPPNPWGSQHMQPTRGASGHAPSQSPQLRPIVTHYAPRPDMHHPHPDMHHP